MTLEKSSDYSIDDPLHLTRILGLSFISIGTCAMILAAIEHRKKLYHIRHEEYRYKSKSGSSLAFIVAISIFLVGLLAFVGILLKSLSLSIF